MASRREGATRMSDHGRVSEENIHLAWVGWEMEERENGAEKIAFIGSANGGDYIFTRKKSG